MAVCPWAPALKCIIIQIWSTLMNIYETVKNYQSVSWQIKSIWKVEAQSKKYIW